MGGTSMCLTRTPRPRSISNISGQMAAQSPHLRHLLRSWITRITHLGMTPSHSLLVSVDLPTPRRPQMRSRLTACKTRQKVYRHEGPPRVVIIILFVKIAINVRLTWHHSAGIRCRYSLRFRMARQQGSQGPSGPWGPAVFVNTLRRSALRMSTPATISEQIYGFIVILLGAPNHQVDLIWLFEPTL